MSAGERTTRIEPVAPAGFADEAAAVLTAAWPPPSVEYTADYLRWQFSFPLALPAVGFAAFDDRASDPRTGRPLPVGFIAAAPLRLRFRGDRFDGYLLSFLAVRPSHRGRGIAAALYAHIFPALRELAPLVVTFAEGGSAGQRSLARAHASAGYALKSLGRCPTFGSVVRPDPSAAPPPDTQFDKFLAATARCDGGHTIWRELGPAQLAHHQRDPRQCALLYASGPSGSAAAMAYRMRFNTARGIETVTTLHSPFMPDPDPAAVRRVFEGAGRRWGDGKAPAVVTAPNLPGIDRAVLKAAGLREGVSRFEGYIASPDPAHPALQAEATNLPVV